MRGSLRTASGSDATVYCNSQDKGRAADCLAYSRIVPLKTLELTKPVAEARDDAKPPSFSKYEGSVIQSLLIDQWSAVKRINNAIDQIENTKQTAAQRAKAAEAHLNNLRELTNATRTQAAGMVGEQKSIADKFANAQEAAANQCGALLEFVAKQEFITYDSMESCGPFGWFECGVRVKWTPRNLVHEDVWQAPEIVDEQLRGPGYKTKDWPQISQLEAACRNARAGLDSVRLEAERAGVIAKVLEIQANAGVWAEEAAKGTALSEWLETAGNILRDAGAIDGAMADGARAWAEIKRLQNEAQLAIDRAKLEEEIAKTGPQLSMGMLRQYHHYDWWRARALLDGARRYAVAARRAIEANYVTDLDMLSDNEPFVAAPNSWVNDIYRYDLSLPSAVGLASTTSVGQQEGAQYPNQVVDYVGNLERFVQGFAVARPMAASVDSEIISIPGPGATLIVNETQVLDPMRSIWSIRCPKASKCTTANSPGWCPLNATKTVANICEATTSTAGAPLYLQPEAARTTFYLDPHAQFFDRSGPDKFNVRVNTRWSKFAVNLVGSGIKDCSRAAFPSECYSNLFLRYRLEHLGPSLAAGATRQWMLLDMPMAQVEGAKASALEEMLDVQYNAWGQPFVESVARFELGGRPVNGNYNIEFALERGVAFDRVETVQILTNVNYWSLQR